MSYRHLHARQGVMHVAASDHALYGIRVGARGSGVCIAPGMATLWLCLRGAATIELDDEPFRLTSRQFLCFQNAAAVKTIANGGGDCLVLAAPQQALPPFAQRRAQPALFPLALPATRELLAAIAALLRHTQPSHPSDPERLLRSLLDAATNAQQAATRPWLERARGRSERHRRQSLLRLVGARNRILNRPFDDHGLDTLAAAARYSKSHFVRAFREVFGRTPHELVIETRMDLAKTLIRGSTLAVFEIAACVGYDSRDSFARLFKKRVGISVGDFRAHAGGARDAA